MADIGITVVTPDGPNPQRRRRQLPMGSGGVSFAEGVREYAILVVLLALFVTLSLANDAFLTKQNLLNVLEQAATVGIMATALTFVTIAGEFDLSIGGIAVIAGVIAAKVEHSVGPLPCFLIGIAAGAALGLLNGLIVSFARVNSFVCTLATGLMITGLGLIITAGALISVSDAKFSNLGFDTLVGVKYSTWIFLIFAAACAFVLTRTRFGRWLFAVGGNLEAARLSGINTRLVKTVAFTISGLAGGVAGVILASRSSSGEAGDGISMVLSAFAAVVVGGTSVAGGRGAVWRTVLGVLFLTLITNGFNLLSVDPVYQQIVQGAIILFAVTVDSFTRRHAT